MRSGREARQLSAAAAAIPRLLVALAGVYIGLVLVGRIPRPVTIPNDSSMGAAGAVLCLTGAFFCSLGVLYPLSDATRRGDRSGERVPRAS